MAGLVPAHLPQTAPAAEHCALQAAAALAGPGTRFFGDCQAVVDAARMGLCPRAWGRLVYGGLLRDAFGHREARPAIESTVKVKAHQTLEGLVGEERRIALGNDLADAAAKRACGWHPRPELQVQRAVRQQVKDAEHVAALVGRAVARWPRPVAEERAHAARGVRPAGIARRTAEMRARAAARRARRTEARRQAEATHSWATVGGTARCRLCLALRRGVAEPCCGAPAGLAASADAATERGHRLWRARATPPSGGGPPAPSFPVLACTRCGAWEAAGASSSLARRCEPPNKGGMAVLSRLRRGLFPRAEARWRGTTVSAGVPWGSGDAARPWGAPPGRGL